MTDPQAVLNHLPPEEARGALARCCGSSRWVEAMLERMPFASAAAVYAEADAIWKTLGTDDFLEAFAHHPQIGTTSTSAAADTSGVDRIDGSKRGALDATAAWSRQEQAQVAETEQEVLNALRAANQAYLERFGFIFIVCATGKSATEMLGLLEARLGNDRARELRIAAGEQARITRLRLEKLAA